MEATKKEVAWKSSRRSLVTLVGPVIIEAIGQLENSKSPWVHVAALVSGPVVKYFVTLWTAQSVSVK